MGKALQYQDEDILDGIIEFMHATNDSVSSSEYQKNGRKPSVGTVINRFGSWDKAIQKAKAKKELSNKKTTKKRTPTYSDEDMLEQIKECMADNNGHVSIQIYQKSKRKPCFSTIVNRFGSWSNAVQKVTEQKKEITTTTPQEEVVHHLTPFQPTSAKIEKNTVEEDLPPLLAELKKLEMYQESALTMEDTSENNNVKEILKTEVKEKRRYNQEELEKKSLWKSWKSIMSSIWQKKQINNDKEESY